MSFEVSSEILLYILLALRATLMELSSAKNPKIFTQKIHILNFVCIVLAETSHKPQWI